MAQDENAVKMAQEAANTAAAAHTSIMSAPNTEQVTNPVLSQPPTASPSSPSPPVNDHPSTRESRDTNSAPEVVTSYAPEVGTNCTPQAQGSSSAPSTVPDVPVPAPAVIATQGSPSTRPSPAAPSPAAATAQRNIPNTPFISYARQAGLAEDLVPSQPNSGPIIPTFHSEWAHVAPEQTRPVREEVLGNYSSKDPTRLVDSMLSGIHEWHPIPVSNMSYKYYVESDREDVRPDLIRFKIMMLQDKETAQDAWSKFVESRRWWIVPSTLRCDRTFCRDTFDCYYLDAMDKIFASELEPVQSECPLFRHDVLDRWWNAFSRKPDFLFELFMRRTAGALISYDYYETCHYTTQELLQHFPRVPPWMAELDIPAGIPIPLPPIAIYFPSYLMEMMREQDQPRYGRAHFFLKREYMGLAIAFWYNEMMYGGRQWVISPSSVSKLRENCIHYDIVKGVPTADILNMMMGRRVRDPTYWNIYKSAAASIPDCHFVDCEPGSGDYHPWMTGDRVELANMRSRKVKLVLRQHRRVQVRRSSPLSLRLLVADLVRIPGLDNYVRDKNWLQVDNIRVHDLLSRLFSRLMKQGERLRNAERELRDIKFDRDGLYFALRDSERNLERASFDVRKLEAELQTYRSRNSERFSGHHIPVPPRQSEPGRAHRNPRYGGHQHYDTPQMRSPILAGRPSTPRTPQYAQDGRRPQNIVPEARSPFIAPGNLASRIPRRPPTPPSPQYFPH